MSTKKFSDFTEGPVQEGDHKFSDIEIVRRSHINVMTKARRDGRIWILKSLAEDLADDLLYQEMLNKECRLLMQVQGHKSIVRCTGMENVEGLGDAYAEVIARCQKPAAQRYSTVSELRTDLDASVRKYHKRQRIRKVLKWLGGIALAICLLLAVFYGISLFRSSNVIHKGDTFKTALDFLRPFGINETETPWGNVLEGRKQLLLWGPEYKNARWHNSGDATQMYPTITEQWGPEGAEPELIHTRNKEHHWMYSRLDELRLTFMKNFVDTGYVFLGVYRMSLTQSDTTKVVWVRVAEEVDIDDLDAVEALRNEPRD